MKGNFELYCTFCGDLNFNVVCREQLGDFKQGKNMHTMCLKRDMSCGGGALNEARDKQIKVGDSLQETRCRGFFEFCFGVV